VGGITIGIGLILRGWTGKPLLMREMTNDLRKIPLYGWVMHALEKKHFVTQNYYQVLIGRDDDEMDVFIDGSQ